MQSKIIAELFRILTTWHCNRLSIDNDVSRAQLGPIVSQQKANRVPPMKTNKSADGKAHSQDSSKLDLLSDCIVLVEQAQIKLDSLGQSIASVHVSQALESIRALHTRVASGLD